MRTLTFRIVITFAIAFIFTSLAMLWISARITRQTMGDFFDAEIGLELQRATAIYQAEGAQAVGRYLAETDRALRGTRYLTDASGRDLATGADHSELPGGLNALGFPRQRNGRVAIVKASADGKYRLLVIAPPPLGLVRFLPYFLAVGVAIALLGLALSAGIVAPLRRLAETVSQFGRGDLSARAVFDRKDEIGQLAVSFDSMALRIETLLTAERRLLQDVSHELRSPLARLSFAAELMKDSSSPDEAIGRMRHEIDRLTQLVSSLLEMTSAEGDPASRKNQPVLMRNLLEGIVEDCKVEAEARDLRIESSLGCSSSVEGDPELLRRAVENVLRNAIRYSPFGSSVSLLCEEVSGMLTVTIRDFGPGVPNDSLDKIFAPFFRVDASRATVNGGIGLGLSIAQRAVLIHQGSITAQNASPGLRVAISIPTLAA
jgi:signal transduction histidine kinase